MKKQALVKSVSIALMLTAIALGPGAEAATSPAFINLSQDDYIGIVTDFSSVLDYTSVSPASSLGKIFGFEIGLIGGGAKTPRVNNLVAENDPGATVNELPDAALLGVVTLPLGITGEIEVMPKESIESSVSDSSIAIAFKWTFSQLFDWPLDAAVKVFSKSAEITYSGVVSGVDTSFDYKDSLTGAQIQVSKSFIVFEPYLTFGFARSKGTMDVAGSGAGSVFNSNYSTTQSASEVVTGTDLNVGVNVNLVLLKLGLEVGQAFTNTKAAAKISFYF
jgi:hypothetical protein